jgi:hypothetical protein
MSDQETSRTPTDTDSESVSKPKRQRTERISIDISVGELCDRLSIAQLKMNKCPSGGPLSVYEKLQNEYRTLWHRFDAILQLHPDDDAVTELADLHQKLERANKLLWSLEDEIRRLMVVYATGGKYREHDHHKVADVAMDIVRANDERCRLKQEISKVIPNEHIEVKIYAEEEKTDPQDA